VQRDFYEVLLAYTATELDLPPHTQLDRAISLKQVQQIEATLLHCASLVDAALSVTSHRSAPLVDQTRHFCALLQKEWLRSLDLHRQDLLARRAEFEKKKRDAHDRRHSKGKPRPFTPLTDEDYDAAGLAERSETAVELMIDREGLLRRGYDQVLAALGKGLDRVKDILECAREFAKTGRPNDDSDCPDLHAAYEVAQRIAREAPTLVAAEPTANRIPFEREFLKAGVRGVLITGPAGFGKTSFCKWHALQDAKAFLDGTARVLPVFVPLHQVLPQAGDKFEDALIQREDIRELLSEEAQRGTRQVRLYLDGLDEVPDAARQEAIMELARQALTQRSSIQIVVTAREHVRGQSLSWLPRLRIADLTDVQVEELVSNWLDQDESQISGFFDQLNRLPALRQLMGVPLLGTLIIAVYRRTGAIPQDRTHLYDLFVELHCGGWDLVKNVRRESKFGSHDKELILSRFAARLHYDSQRDGDPADFEKCVKETLPGFSKKWRVLLDEVLEDGLLTRVGSKLIFSHLSFQEYMTARYLAEPEGQKATSILRLFFRGNDWWKEVLSFYVGMYSRPQDVSRWLEKHRRAVSVNLGTREQGQLESRYSYLMDSIRSVYPASG